MTISYIRKIDMFSFSCGFNYHKVSSQSLVFSLRSPAEAKILKHNFSGQFLFLTEQVVLLYRNANISNVISK